MKTTVYFVRHAQPNYANHDDASRELSAQGLADTRLVTAYLQDKAIDIALSSPYKRAVDTIRPFAELHRLPIRLVEGFRERKVDSGWIEDFDAFTRQQWADFDYKLSDGESLREVQTRGIAALNAALLEYLGKNIVVGSHGTALSTIVHFYDSSFGIEDFIAMRHKMPWIVTFTFGGDVCIQLDKIDLFAPTNVQG